MGSTGFLKTVKMGGFDKKDVLNYVDELNAKIYKLENELTEKNDLLAGKQDASSNFEGAEKYEARLAESKAKISELMAAVDTLKLQTSNLENELEEKNSEISKLHEENVMLKEKADSAESNAPSMTNASFDIGNVFIEAKHSADRIITEAKNAAKKIEDDTRVLSDQVLEEANKKAEEIVVNASSRSSSIIEDAKSKADSELEKAKSEATIILEETNKTKQSVMSSFDAVTTDIEKLAACLNEIVSSGSLKLVDAKAIMENSRQNVKIPNSLNTLASGGNGFDSEKKNW